MSESLESGGLRRGIINLKMKKILKIYIHTAMFISHCMFLCEVTE